MELSRRIDELTASLENTLTGAERQAIVDTARPFVVDRNACGNQGDLVGRCVGEVLEQRRNGLEAASEDPARAFDEISRYESVDVPFALRWAEYLEGTIVRVWGCFSLDPGPSPEVRLRGTIGETCGDPPSPSLPALFDRMDLAGTSFFARLPARRWRGRVEVRDGRPVLIVKLDEI